MKDSLSTIRRIGADDVEAFRRIRLEALREEPSAYASSYEDWAGLTDEEWRNRMSEPVVVAFRGDEPVGLMGLMRQRSSKMLHRASIVMVYVRKSQRGTGVADNLIEAIIEEARAMGIVQLELAVTADNRPAVRFYERMGFVPIGRVPGALMHEGRELDDLMMARRIG
ncbi:GNAT family N-acetyltransferase [Pleomorphomonas diazotrophica]|uniref:GNAT family N-acetyltransferase n=1 Tax=Pleomorphomonas diazotrophica TaxID=1166257 RepID=A0A1I4UH77_9HYPH|nr:GNAT family N-acetyltransferase [Pleomorphomonas diazotrophica]PKR89185.1 GNAT family N-acetyltransferase [Pleomorphomonas diazotrophica]SFM88332.1 L-amino acid N-acyltransferase YncA [Pleomorphomonas diazotrophica]